MSGPNNYAFASIVAVHGHSGGDDMRPIVRTMFLLLTLVSFVVGCDGQRERVTDETEETSSSTTEVTRQAKKSPSATTEETKGWVSEKQSKSTASKTPATPPQKTFTIIDEGEGGLTGTDTQRFDATILVTDKSDSSLITSTEQLRSHYSGFLETHREVNFYFFTSEDPASRYLHASDDEYIELDEFVVAFYSFNRALGQDELYAQENASPRKLKEF